MKIVPREEVLGTNKATRTRLSIVLNHLILFSLSTWSRGDSKSPYKHRQKRFKKVDLVVTRHALQCSSES